ncbi:contractile injection system tape measure protein [Parapedobacter tibetensis]|uniref:contractile injection system tape measure protein n=1 Tax=Parapedobacter tibetensis TaxID=2972951 RepID=UPI00214D31F5|nr:contractile injection system tape measure protein [Parapedobacter tibetensis]
MSVRNHIIHRQSIQVDFDRSEDETGLPNRIATVFYERIQPGMEQLFDQYFKEKSDVHLPLLTLDCGVLSRENWEDRLVEKTMEELQQQLRSMATTKTYNKQSLKEQYTDELLYYLIKGRFKWANGSATLVDMESSISIDKRFIDRIGLAIRQSSDTLDRLFHVLSASFIRRLVDSIAAQLNLLDGKFASYLLKQQLNSDRLHRAIIGSYATYCAQADTSNVSWPALFTSAYSVMGDATDKLQLANSVAAFIQDTAEGKRLIEDDSTWQRILFSSIQALVPDKTNQLFRVLERIMTKQHAGMEDDTDSERVSKEEKGKNKKQRAKNRYEKDNDQDGGNTPKDEHPNQGEQDVDNTEDEIIYIDNAGLVIVHPFLKPLFETLGLLTERDGAEPEVNCVAPVLLQYLLQGDEAITESQLPLNKILCGLSPEAFVSCDVKLPAGSAQACEELLVAIIDHWSALKNTSPAGLRETFMQRGGKLTKIETGWRLEVEAKGVDVLLSHLPWGIGAIKLPWMNDMLVVEWA